MSDRADSAILIHGLWMHGVVFTPHQRWLERKGLAVRRFSYPSWSRNLETNARCLANFVDETRGSKIHLVAHSLGGLVALTMLAKDYDPRIHRVVLMGTPYTGCYAGTYIKNKPFLSSFLGLSVKDWLALPHPVLPKSVDIGVIAGTRSWGLGRVVPGLPRPNDGMVCVDETQVPEARDNIALPISHSGMLLSPTCAEQVASFIRTGSFIHV